MLALYIILGIIVAIFLLLLVPLRFSFLYEDEAFLTVKYLFFKYQILPEAVQDKPKTPAKKTKKGKLPQKKKNPVIEKIKGIIKRRGALGFLQLAKDLIVLLTQSLKNIVKHVKVKELDIYFACAATQVGDAAMMYGEACAAIYPIVAFITKIAAVKKYGVTVDVDYNEVKPFVLATANFNISPIFIFHHLIKLLFKGILLIKN